MSIAINHPLIYAPQSEMHATALTKDGVYKFYRQRGRIIYMRRDPGGGRGKFKGKTLLCVRYSQNYFIKISVTPRIEPIYIIGEKLMINTCDGGLLRF